MIPDARRELSSAAVVALLKAIVSGTVLATGFRAVSDDDFARVVIAETWARSPRWDASGTSWLPAPFWFTGEVMRVLGRSLDTARAVSVGLGIGAAVGVYVAARWLGAGRVAAIVGASVASIFPWSARLGVATVPELPAAALTLVALAALAPAPDVAKRRLAGAACLVIATLSRYEAWPVALVFSAVCIADVRQAERRCRAALIGAASLALAGPIAWLVSTWREHGDALHFVSRVTAYRRALGAAEDSVLARLFAYPVSLVREAPELVTLLLASVALALMGDRVDARKRLSSYARPALVVLAQVAALSFALMKDGAPTHHAERAMLTAMLLAAVAGGVTLAETATSGSRPRGVVAAICVTAAVIVASLLSRREPTVDRRDEESIGRAAAATCTEGERVLVEVDDYGYLAVEAALGRPEDIVPDRSIDPRDAPVGSSFDDPDTLARRVERSGAQWVIAKTSTVSKAILQQPSAVRGAWALYPATRAR